MDWTLAQREWADAQAWEHMVKDHGLSANPGMQTSDRMIQCRGCRWVALLTDSGACVVAYGPLLSTVALPGPV